MIKKIVAVVGGRDFTDYNRLKKILDSVKGKISSLVSGGAKGADQLVEKYAEDNQFNIKVFNFGNTTQKVVFGKLILLWRVWRLSLI